MVVDLDLAVDVDLAVAADVVLGVVVRRFPRSFPPIVCTEMWPRLGAHCKNRRPSNASAIYLIFGS